MNLQKMAQDAAERLSAIEVAQSESMRDIESILSLYPNGFSMYNQAQPWADFVKDSLTIKIVGSEDDFALTGFFEETLTAYNKSKAEWTRFAVTALPAEIAPQVLNQILKFLKPQNDV